MSPVREDNLKLRQHPTAPMSEDEFASLMSQFAPFDSSGRFALAVSGGPDSMALAYCMQRWTSSYGGTLKAYIVNHGLRFEAAEEARTTEAQLANIHIPAEILIWKHEPVLSRLHATARKARYDLMITACKNEGFPNLLLAHQREDQAETVLMRLAKGSGIDGLTGIAAENIVNEIRLLRPLLTIAKERLIATCTTHSISFVTDSSNASEKYARGRLRRVMPLLSQEGLTLERILDLQTRASDIRDALDHATAALLNPPGLQDEFGVIKIDLYAFLEAPRAIAERALNHCLQMVCPEDYGAEYASLRLILDQLHNDASFLPHTLHGCLISVRDDHLILIREPSAVREITPISPGETVVWDHRWIVTLETSDHSHVIRPLGNPSHEILDNLAPDLRHRLPQGRARASLPSLWRGDKLALIPNYRARNISDFSSAKLQNTHFRR